jgi:xanthine/uracil permease
MSISQWLILGAFELLGLFVVAQIWLRKRHKNVFVRVIWSGVLLAPLFGILAYFFLRDSPEKHSSGKGRIANDAIAIASDETANH